MALIVLPTPQGLPAPSSLSSPLPIVHSRPRRLAVSRPTLIAYSQIRWDDPDPRPRQVFTRLAATRRVLFVEEPVGGAVGDSWERLEKGRNLAVHRPHLAGEVHGFEPAQAHRLARLLEQLVAAERVGRHTAWVSTPLAYLPAQSLAPEVIV